MLSSLSVAHICMFFMPDHLRLQEAEDEEVFWGLCLLAMTGELYP